MQRSTLIPFALLLPLALTGCDDGSERIGELERQIEEQRAVVLSREADMGSVRTELEGAQTQLTAAQTELQKAQARILELESADKGIDAQTLRDPLNAIVTRLREHEVALQDLGSAAGDPDQVSAIAERMQTGIDAIAQELRTIAQAAGVEAE